MALYLRLNYNDPMQIIENLNDIETPLLKKKVYVSAFEKRMVIDFQALFRSCFFQNSIMFNGFGDDTNRYSKRLYAKVNDAVIVRIEIIFAVDRMIGQVKLGFIFLGSLVFAAADKRKHRNQE